MDGGILVVAGIMSGTSADGVDVVIARLSVSGGPRPRATVDGAVRHHTPYTPAQRALILGLCRPGAGTAEEVARAHVWLGAVYTRAVLDAARGWGTGDGHVDLIACHGQTVFHAPPSPGTPGDGGLGATLQLGSPAVIAALSGITTVGDFRPADMALGGQGAPLVPYADLLLFGSQEEGRVALNIGGIANLSVLPAACDLDGVIGFDCGPGGMVIDAVVEALTSGRQTYDAGGHLAAGGRVRPDLLEELLDNPFFSQPPPRSTGREGFGEAYVGVLLTRVRDLGLSTKDAVATVTALTARTIAHAYTAFAAPRLGNGKVTMIVAGGGARNETLLRLLKEELPPGVEVAPSERFGVPAEDREALAFAVLGYQTLHGRPTSLPSCTGARGPAVLGVIAPGANYTALLDRVVHTNRANSAPATRR